MSLRKTILFSIILFAAIAVSITALQTQQVRLSDKLIRLHVVANSDSNIDQQIKLEVRDAVLNVTENILKDVDEPEKCLQENLSSIQLAAEQCLRMLDCSDPVFVSFGLEEFPTREYDSFSLPAGVYKSLRITIGDGKGRNWWCVVFPSICMRSASDMKAVAATAGLSKQEINLITGKYTVKFKIFEVIQQLQKQLTYK